MTKIVAELKGQGLAWVKPNSRRDRYELLAEDRTVIATMLGPSMSSDHAEVDAAGNHWTFDRQGFICGNIVIRSAGTGQVPAEFIYHTAAGKLEYHDGSVFLWQPGAAWDTEWVWTTANGMPLMGIESGGLLKAEGKISLTPNSNVEKAPSLLIFLGWYLIVLHNQDFAATLTVLNTLNPISS